MYACRASRAGKPGGEAAMRSFFCWRCEPVRTTGRSRARSGVCSRARDAQGVKATAPFGFAFCLLLRVPCLTAVLFCSRALDQQPVALLCCVLGRFLSFFRFYTYYACGGRSSSGGGMRARKGGWQVNFGEGDVLVARPRWAAHCGGNAGRAGRGAGYYGRRCSSTT